MNQTVQQIKIQNQKKRKDCDNKYKFKRWMNSIYKSK
jgi:hypothetical protein